ncbi:MAG: DUF5658 family protein [Candidatus Aminicenantes bacterium]|nr:DUF5658 family protein [Candidatus Aminicenantes bacterium]
MKTGNEYGLSFLKTIIMGVLMVAFVAHAPMTASEKTESNNEVFSAKISFETVIIDSGFTPPAPRTAIASMEFSLKETEITSNARSLTLSPKKLSLQSYSISPQDISFTPRQKGNAGFTAALASTVLLHAADYFTTVNALKFSTLEEGNPFMKKIASNNLLFGAIKLGVAGLQVTLLKGLYKKNKTLAWIVGTAMNAALSGVVANNLSKIRRAKSCLGY